MSRFEVRRHRPRGRVANHHCAIATLDRILEPVGRALNVEAARALVELHLDAQAQARIDRLARKANEGRLTVNEKSEDETYVSAIDFVAILQAKARALLARSATA